MNETAFHLKMGTIITLDMNIDHLQAVATEYREQASKKDKTAKYNLNRCEEAIKTNLIIRKSIYRELKPVTQESDQLLDNVIEENSNLFYDIISLDYKDQHRIKSLIKKIKKP